MSSEQSIERKKAGSSAALIYLLVFFSGFAGLVYQVLWMKQLGLLFGNTSHAAAATLAAFFAGLAGGSWFWGKRSTTTSNPLRVYAGLELGVAVTALLYFVILHLFYAIYPHVYQSVASVPLLLLIKFVLALVLIFPPAFCMGGTIPVIGQALIRNKKLFGIQAARLYGVNTLGAAVGAFTAGFYLVRLVGFNMTCIGSIVVSCLVAATAYHLSRRTGPKVGEDEEEQSVEEEVETEETQPKKASTKKRGKRSRKRRGKSNNGERAISDESPQEGMRSYGGRGAIYAVCFLSGFGVLALEVLWTRMFAQIHENSIYSFSSVLVVVLVCLAFGALIASRLARMEASPMTVLAALLATGGMAIAISPFVFKRLTNDFQMQDTRGTFLHYTLILFLKGFIFIGLPALSLGTVFPFLMKTEERFEFEPGRSLGRLSAVNTIGAILGSLLCGFVMLEFCGMWRTMQIIAAMYLVAGLLMPVIEGGAGLFIKGFSAISLLLLFSFLSPMSLRVVGWDPARPRERVVEVWEASDCTVAVVLRNGHRVIKINSNYSLGSTDASAMQDFQGRLPMLIYPKTESVFFLGLGTGMTAAGSIDPQFKDLDRVVVCELSPAVVTAAKKYMTGNPIEGLEPIPDFTKGLFEDKRVEIVVEDGRHYLMAADNTFDMVNADLFLPYRSGAGSLYSREHYASAKAKLNPGGVYVQWLPMYQITETEFGTIARTMLEVFPRVTMWRSDFQPGAEAAALVGHKDESPLPGSSLDVTAEKRVAVAGMGYDDSYSLLLPMNQQTILLFYCGNVTAAKELFAEYPVNTDDKPVIEYTAPLSLRREFDTIPPTMVGPRLTKVVDRIQALCPPATDPMLVNRTPENRRLPVAGAAFHRARVGEALQDVKQIEENWELFIREWTNEGSDQPATPKPESEGK